MQVPCSWQTTRSLPDGYADAAGALGDEPPEVRHRQYVVIVASLQAIQHPLPRSFVPYPLVRPCPPVPVGPGSSRSAAWVADAAPSSHRRPASTVGPTTAIRAVGRGVVSRRPDPSPPG
jgi:hypothetical protein